MRYLLDTDTLSGLMRSAPLPVLLRRIAAVPPAEQATSSITLGELLYGAHRLGDRGAALLDRIAELVTANLVVFP
ncbi:MAG: type II toxin-antitoxin system VapC family toxin, partial [Dehalococcoidia bacterium]|nr:type II toxin-antitoxin system VapC family toxin [Dehalococcoidia bacterium]